MELPLQSATSTSEGSPSFRQMLAGEDGFNVRRAVERLREGLFDPVAVRLLTAHEERLRMEFERGFGQLGTGECPHLCLVGSYGQGKTHSLVYIEDLALRNGFATSRINLDPREVPFYNFRAVYRELLHHLKMPDSDESLPLLWKKWARRQMKERGHSEKGILDIIPSGTPQLFKAVMAAMAHANLTLSDTGKRLKKHAAFRPGEFPMLLARALDGEAVPIRQLRQAFKYRGVPLCRDDDYRDEDVRCRGQWPFLLMVRSLSRLFRAMGYRGWVLLFDEGESISQANVSGRSKSYMLLDRLLFAPGVPDPSFLYPIFAFTDDFFQRVREEDYDRSLVRRGTNFPRFEKNYVRDWENLNSYPMHDLSGKEWKELSERLLCLHARAYGWHPLEVEVIRKMENRLEAARPRDTRFKLKALVDCLDLVQQEQVLNNSQFKG